MKLWYAAVAVLGAFAAGCSVIPSHGRTEFVARNWRIIRALSEAKKKWADSGVLIAKQIVIGWGGRGVPVRFCGQEKLTRMCEDSNRQGCVTYTATGRDFKSLWILDSIDDDRLLKVVMHEMIHILVPDMPHLPPGITGVMSTDANSGEVTSGDLEQLCSYTECSV